MTPDPFDPYAQQPMQAPTARRRPWRWVGATAVAVAAVGLGAASMLKSGSHVTGEFGEGLKIAVVQPVEPKVQPGGVMDVGELTDGFTYVRAQMQPPVDSLDDNSWDDLPPLPPLEPEPRRVAYREAREPAVLYVPPQPPQPVRVQREERSFGFDAPRPDWRAEREARRARMEAMNAQAMEQAPGARYRRIDRARDMGPPQDRADLGPAPSEVVSDEEMRRSANTFY